MNQKKSSYQRKFLPQELRLTSWGIIEPYTEELLNRNIGSISDLKQFIEDHNEIDILIWDEESFRYIDNCCHTNDDKIRANYNDFVENIDSKAIVYMNKINSKIIECPLTSNVDWPGFIQAIKRLENLNSIFREQNVPLITATNLKKTEVSGIRGKMQVVLDGEKQTLNKAEDRLHWNDRAKREEAWKAVIGRIFEDKDSLDKVFDEMFILRQKQAKNAGFENFRDFRFSQLNRTDYSPEDCYNFHQSVKENVVPIVREMHIATKKQLNLEILYPWDLAVDPLDRKPLRAFENESDLIDKAQKMFDRTDKDVGDMFRLLRENQQLDLMSRPGKRAGAFCRGIQETGMPFIFQNATEQASDIKTIAHESGHGLHRILSNHIPLLMTRRYPSEVAELASISMELFTMDHWNVFFENKEQLFRAQREHLENIIKSIPWISIVDEFQHKLYLQDNPSIEKRHELWADLCQEYKTGEVETEAHIFDHPDRNSWLKQNHIFEMPFYYIDYSIAKLGALEIWRNFKKNPQATMSHYKDALELGYTKSISEIYRTAGASFDFGSDNIKNLMQFVGTEITNLRERELIEFHKNNPNSLKPI